MLRRPKPLGDLRSLGPAVGDSQALTSMKG